jgi:FkbM family methyltransferase
MTRTAVNVARRIYRSTPVPALRRLYFAVFCRLVRGRRVRATIDGITYDLDLGEIIDVSVYLQQYEREVAAAIRRFCRPGMTALDIGANIGAHTLLISQLVGHGGAVYAFEPTAFAYEKLAQNLSLNDVPQAHAVRAALAERAHPQQTVAFRASWRTDGSRADGRSVVDFIRLDDWARENGVERVDLVKIDIDGNEFPALAGGMELLARSRPTLVMEAVSPHFSDASRNPFALLQGIGYRFRDARTGEEYASVDALARRLPENDREMTMSLNVIASAAR